MGNILQSSFDKNYYNFHFFNHRFTQDFEIDLDIYGDGGECFNFSSKLGTAKY